jgi:hypothetical protein
MYHKSRLRLRRRAFLLFPASAVLLLLFTAGWAQTLTSTILGTVVDAQGSLIVGASVTVTSEGTGEQRQATTDGTGGFSFPGLQPGNYTLRVESKGFQTYQRKGIVLTASQRLPVGNIQMNVGSVSETVTVTAEAAVVSTASAEGSADLNSRQIETIAQRGRNVASYLTLLPGVSTSALENEALNTQEIGSVLPNVGGIRNTSISIGMDGMSGQDNGTSSTYTTSESPESVAEVKVLLSNYQAEYGRNGGAVINLVTKSGTMQYHGSGYWYKRHEMFNAQNFFNNAGGIAKPRYRYLTGGFTLGGPVTIPGVFNTSKEKLFFFFNFETNPSKEPQSIVRRTMPTALEIGGDFSQSLDQNGKPFTIRDPTTNAPFSGNQIPVSRLNASGQALLKILPQPNRLDRTVTLGAYNYEYQDLYAFGRTTELFKIDYRPTSSDSLFFRGTYWDSSRTGNVTSSGSYQFAVLSNIYYNKHGVLNYTRVVSPTMVNDLNFGFRRPQERLNLADSDPAAKVMKRSQMGFTAGQWHPEINPDGIIPQAGFSGVANAPDFGNFYWYRVPQREDDINLTLSDGYTIIRAKHSFKVGLYFEKARIASGFGMGTIWNGYFNFGVDTNNPLNTGNPYSNAVLGNFLNYQEATNRTKPAATAINLDWYVQDSWKLTRRLTLEIGLRTAYYTPWYQWDGQNTGWSLQRFNPSKAPLLYRPGMSGSTRVAVNPVTGQTTFAALIGGIVPGTGDPGNGFVTTRDGNYPVGFYEKSGELPQPRFGFAWDVFGDGKTAIRGGFAKFNQLLRYEPQSAGPPISYTPMLYYDSLSTFLNASGTLFPGTAIGYDRYMKAPNYYNITLGVQRNLGFGTVLDVKYVSALGRNLGVTTNINQLPYGVRFLPENQDPTNNKPLSDAFLRPYQGLGTITYRNSSGSSNYHAMQATANRQIAQGLQFGVSYTYGKVMDYGTSMPTYNSRRTWAYGKATFDQTHALVINYTYDLPRFSRGWENPVTKLALDHWQVSGVTTFASGTPQGISLSTTTGVDLTGGGDGQRVIIRGDPRLPHGERTVDHIFNTSVFALPGKGDRGNAPPDVFRGPGQNNFDMTLFKSIPIKSEQRRLTLRWEIYNLLNHPNFTSVDNTVRYDPATGAQTNARFGKAIAARQPRVMQASVKFTF